MKAFLLYPDRDFDMEQPLPWQAPTLIQDLELNTLFNAMALGDKFLFNVAQKVVLSSRTDLNIIRYRQNILKDCLNHPAIVRSIYDLAVAAIEGEKKAYWGVFSKYPPAILDRAIQVLKLFVSMLRQLRTIVEEQTGQEVAQRV